jgi:hypothetical protein
MSLASTHAILLAAVVLLSAACAGKRQTIVGDGSGAGSSTGGGGSIAVTDADAPADGTSAQFTDGSAAAEADAARDGGAPAECVRVPPDGLITDFSKQCPADGPNAGQACFGQWGITVFGATWQPYPKPEAGTDTSTAHGDVCTTYGSQSTLTSSVATGAWVLSGTVATWSGTGIWLSPCVNASAFKGIEFTISGDAGPSGVMTLSVTQLSNWADTDGGGTCSDTCLPAKSTFNVTSTPTPVSVLWADLTGGVPAGSIDAPAGISKIEWELDWPCSAGAPYPVNITIDDLKFFK